MAALDSARTSGKSGRGRAQSTEAAPAACSKERRDLDTCILHAPVDGKDGSSCGQDSGKGRASRSGSEIRPHHLVCNASFPRLCDIPCRWTRRRREPDVCTQPPWSSSASVKAHVPRLGQFSFSSSRCSARQLPSQLPSSDLARLRRLGGAGSGRVMKRSRSALTASCLPPPGLSCPLQIEASWVSLPAREQERIYNELQELQKKDWKELSLDQKKAGQSHVLSLLAWSLSPGRPSEPLTGFCSAPRAIRSISARTGLFISWSTSLLHLLRPTRPSRSYRSTQHQRQGLHRRHWLHRYCRRCLRPCPIPL